MLLYLRKKISFGGILTYGIPEYRLPKKIIDKVIENIIKSGVKVRNETIYGVDISSNDLFEMGFEAIFIAFGASKQKYLQVPGSNLKGIYGANEFLGNIEKYKFKNVAVIGGGNVAMDVASMAKFNNAEKVYIIYRREKEMMPANRKEIEDVIKKGIEFKFCSNLLQIMGEEKVEKIECINTKIDGEKVNNIDGSNYFMDVDTVVMAIGTVVDNTYLDDNMKLNINGLIEVNESLETNFKNIYAGGDAIYDKPTVCMAIKSGIEAAHKINEMCMQQNAEIQV